MGRRAPQGGYAYGIGLYSNVLDTGGGIISSQGGRFPLVNDQLDFLTEELERLKPERQALKRAVLIAVHHPPLSVDAKTGGSSGLMQDIDSFCKAAGLWPDALSRCFLVTPISINVSRGP